MVLADCSVVVLALPEIYRELDVSVTAVTWVLVAFNLVLALAAVPGRALRARRRRRRGSRSRGIGDLRRREPGLRPRRARSALLLAARCVQAVGGAAAVCASLELLPSVVGLGASRGDRLGGRGRARRGARAGRRRPADRADLVAVDLPRPGADRGARAALALPGAARAEARPDRRPPSAEPAGPAAPGRQRRPRAGLGRARRGALPRRPAADRGLAADARSPPRRRSR